MKQLQQQFKGRGEVKGYTFTQIRVTDKGFIYSKELNGSLSYEVFKRKENKRFDCISYPTSNSFGVWAWDCKTLERAEEILNNFK
mgnify:CR=1 FL=1